MIYIFYFSDGAGPKTGLSPTIDIFIKVSDGTSAGTPPTPTELSGGFYKVTYAPAEDAAIRIDSNDATMAGVDRYIPFVASPHDDDLDASVSGRAPANEYDTQIGYIPSNLGDVPTATELIAAHGTGAWTTADVSALATSAGLATTESNIRGADSDDLKTISDQVDSVAIESNIEAHVTNSLNTYDPPTRAETTSDKDAIIVEVNANETKIDALPTANDAQLSVTHGAGSWVGSSTAAIADAVWDEDLTGHNTSKTAGWFVKKIKSIADAILAMVT